ncbi:MAG: translation elongation factor-like protein [Omnitrophica bacterium RIFCSPHIGHO2_02_FULL_46_11]|nr:MAG: translation elongation factor-like protein [Omnitrophica bacterium RIFCSPHIGHO2_02_FULL_46_11]OGW86373.1 MAG: translation elongation factor-like protein [Omnitrophica bacterium RIFCSPLOWO2_01_FULL_45_10b]
MPKNRIIGVVTHYFPHVQAAVVKLKKPLAVGDTILLKGTTTDFEQTVASMQIDRIPLQNAKKGDEIGLQVKERVREHDLVLSPA